MTEHPIDVPRLAHSYRRLVLWFGVQLVLNFIAVSLNLVGTPSVSVAVRAVMLLLGVIATLAALAVFSYRTAGALGSSVAVLWAIAMFVPCANVVTLLALSAKATAACRANGIPVGFLGPKLPGGELTALPPSGPPPSINP